MGRVCSAHHLLLRTGGRRDHREWCAKRTLHEKVAPASGRCEPHRPGADASFFPLLVLWLALITPVSAAAQERTTAQPLILDPVVVTATRLPERLTDVPAAISVVEQPDIQEARPTVSLDEPLNRVPGVFVQNSDNFAQDFRIQIRGFGTRAAFGVREIKVLVDGLPETLPDGQTELDGIDLGAIGRIEVLRGPASSLYGNASGGVIQLFTEDGPDVPTAEARLTGGSFGFGKYQLKGGGHAGTARLFLSGSFLQLDGYRDHSATRSGIVNGKLRFDLNDRTDVTLLLNGVDAPVAEDPGGLTRAEADNTPRQASPLNVQLHAGEDVQQGRLGIVAHHHTDSGEISAYTYGLYRDFSNNLPIPPSVPPDQGGIVTFHRFSPGGGLRYLYAAPFLGWTQDLTAGVDVQYQDDERRRYSNVYGQRGALGLQQRDQVTGVGPYLRETIFLRPDLEVDAGVRYDNVRFATDVRYPPNSGASGSRTFDQWSPAGGIRYSPQRWLSLFGDIGTAFQVPTTTELANPNGPGFNPDVGPQNATSYEAGARTQWDRAQGEVVGYFVDITDELIPYELQSQPGRTFFRNAGRSQRYGMEMDWQADLIPSLRWTSAITLMHAEYRDYTTAQGSFDGNDEPGIPPWQVYEELRYQHRSGLFAAFEAFVVNSYFVDDANLNRSPSYALCNLRAGYERTFGNWNVGPFVGLDNLADAHYDGRVRLNAQNGRFYEPAPTFNAYGGIAISAHL
jgi:iron complex outermembrane receptor protein